MEQSTDNREFEIDLGKILYKMRNKYIIIVLITVFAVLITGVVTKCAITPKYSATVKMYVYANTDRITTDSSISSQELEASQDLVNTYIYILESNTVLNAVMEDLQLEDMTLGQLKRSISASQADKTIAFEVTVTTDNAKRSAQIANSIAKIVPSEIVRVIKAGGVEIIDYAETPKAPSSPNLTKNVALAGIISFILSFAGFFLYELFDTTITSTRDIEGEFDIPVIGTVPNLGTSSNDAPYNSNYGKSNKKSTAELKPSDQILENLQNMKGDNK
ncbi:MAG TPA: hypothetical protein DCZ02_03720 [Ruminococcaceae bacterium]|nr:hypothetical protein [Oscillospiraceae bacterium]